MEAAGLQKLRDTPASTPNHLRAEVEGLDTPYTWHAMAWPHTSPDHWCSLEKGANFPFGRCQKEHPPCGPSKPLQSPNSKHLTLTTLRPTHRGCPTHCRRVHIYNRSPGGSGPGETTTVGRAAAPARLRRPRRDAASRRWDARVRGSEENRTQR